MNNQRIYHLKGDPQEIGVTLGRMICSRLEQKISRYISERPGRHSSVNLKKLRSWCAALAATTFSVLPDDAKTTLGSSTYRETSH
jgi:hypothetical protein